ncbi:MAG: 3-phosphoglycerate dehydrogenase [Firmicutes bacterium]|nr:3-phosphoglycerate dehydrogenase [Bacillota bacterium]
MKVACLNNISSVGLNEFTKKYDITEEIEKSNLILVRSFNMHSMEIPKHLIAVARAGAGVNNIPIEEYAKQGIVVFNTPGANANAVKELVLTGMLLASRDVIGGVNWVKENASDESIAKTVEKAKSAFAGNEIMGKTIGLIGLGQVGSKVANACVSLGLKVIGFDPYLSDELRNSLDENVAITQDLDTIYQNSDFISLHVPLLDTTKGMMNQAVFAKTKKGLVLLNFSRDALVDDLDLEVAIQEGIVRKYVTDFPNPKVASMNGVIAIPHLGASTEESEDNCAYMASHELMAYAELGIIKNSVNYPAIDPGKKDTLTRIVILHHAEELMNAFMNLFFNKPVMNIISKSRGEVAVTIFDIDEEIPTDCVQKLKDIKGVFKVRKI